MEFPKRLGLAAYGRRSRDGSFQRPGIDEKTKLYWHRCKTIPIRGTYHKMSYVLVDEDYVNVITFHEPFETFFDIDHCGI